MKRLFILLLLILPLFLHAQDNTWNRFYLGVNSGLNYSRVNFESSVQKMFNLQTDQNFLSGYSGGLVFIYYPEPNFGLQVEVNYTQRGWWEDLGYGECTELQTILTEVSKLFEAYSQAILNSDS